MDTWHGEGLIPVFNEFAIPVGLPAEIVNGNCLFVLTKNSSLTHVINCTVEAITMGGI